VLDFGFRVSGVELRVSGVEFGFRVLGLDFGFRVSGFGFWVSGFDLRVSSFGFRDQDSTKLRVQDLSKGSPAGVRFRKAAIAALVLLGLELGVRLTP